MIYNFDHFSRWNIEFVKNLHTFKNSYLFNNDSQKKSDALGNILIFFKTSYKKFHSKIHLHVKVFLGKKNMQSFFKSNPFGS